MSIQANNITKSYHGHEALKDFSAEFKSGRITGLLGPNGAGKTTFIRILNQIIGQDSGELLVDGKRVEQDFIDRIGYLPEERGLYKKMKVLKQVVYLAQIKGLSKEKATERANEWLDKLGLSEWKNKRVEQLSKGMAQKVQFISTVIHDPDVIILDEPFSGFDPINTNEIRNTILELKDAGKTIILSTHNMGSVEEICDDIILLNQGEKLLDGELKGVKQDFREEVYRVTFRGNIIGFTNALWAGYELIDREQLGNEHFSVRIKLIGNNTINDLLNTTIPHVKIEGVQEILPGMEDIFIKSVNKEDGES